MEGRKEIQQAQTSFTCPTPCLTMLKGVQEGLHAEESVFGLKGVVRKMLLPLSLSAKYEATAGKLKGNTGKQLV